MLYIRCSIIIILNFFCVSVLHAQSSFSVGVERLEGFSQYEIGGFIQTPQGSGYVHFPISRLKFPLDVEILALSFSRQLNSGLVELKFKQIQHSSRGTMEDSDWLFDPSLLDIYSESDSQADGSIFSFMYQRPFVSNTDKLKKFFELGLISQKFEFEAGNTRQYEYIDLDQAFNNQVRVPLSTPVYTSIQGPTITYTVKYTIPYVAFSGDYQISPKSNLDARIGYSPMVSAKDDDNHLLRSKISTGDMDGKAVFYELGLSFRSNDNDKLNINFSKMTIDTSGRQTQVDASGAFATIDETNVSEQKSIKIEYTHYFE